jgi:GntR family transcriptional regulator/MocR family aminotransferase
MLATLLMGKGSKVAMEDPGYPDARSTFQLAGAETVPVPVDQSGIVTERIPSDAGFVFITPSHHCPTMIPLSEERRRDLLARADRHNQIVIEDGYDSQLLDDAPQQALKSVDRSGRVVYVGSMSKTLAPGLRLGYIVASAGLISELRALRRFMLRHPPANNQRAVALFLSLGHHEALVRRLSSAFDERRKRLRQVVSAFLPEWRSEHPGAGTSMWLEAPRGVNARDLAVAASSSSPATAISASTRNRRASCGSAFPRSLCSTSSLASANLPPLPAAGPQQPEPLLWYRSRTSMAHRWRVAGLRSLCRMRSCQREKRR